ENKKYFAVCHNSQGKEKRIELPNAINNGCSIFADWRNKRLIISLIKTENFNNNQQLSILVHSRGNLMYFENWDQSKTTISFAQEQLPPGIIQIVLFDDNMNPISERLVFCKNEQQANTTIFTDKERYKMREKVETKIEITDNNENPIQANLSVAIIDEKDVALDESHSILATFLLSSELKGHIESPGLYFTENTDESRYALDCLMMTQGWRRYNLSNVAHGYFEEPNIKNQLSMEITGQVLHKILPRPASNSQVSLIISEYKELLQTITDENGRFNFEGIEFYDKMDFIIQSLSARGGNNVRLKISPPIFPNVRALSTDLQPYYWYSNKETNDTIKESFLEKSEERYKYDEDMRVIHLQAVEVVASRINRDRRNTRSVYSISAAYSVNSQVIEENNPKDIMEILRIIPGVSVFPDGSISLQNRHARPAIYLNDMLIIEGVSESSAIFGGGENAPALEEFIEALNIIHVSEIEQIDIFTGAEAAIFGSKGGSGVISITSKQGNNIRTSVNQSALNRLHITPFGYQKPVEFYSPVYDTEEKRFDIKPDLRTTLFWKPDLIVDTNGEISFDFYTADYTSTYVIIIEGITPRGDILRTIKRIRVD
ncbi:Plug domain-containing protein, partial [Parabacteroides sp. OttesenSCG-928-G07]|nr:Plug domain-containing protein [Parabacteroides sp. OttesenSCG-928-G07]